MPRMRWFYNYSSTFKGMLFVFAAIIIVAQVWYTNTLVAKLRAEQREMVTLNASLLSNLAQSSSIQDFSFFFDITSRLSFPIILTDTNGIIASQRNTGIEADPPFKGEDREKLLKMISEMDKENQPIPIKYGDILVSEIHYGDSTLIGLLSWLPIIQVFIVGIFAIIAFVGFNNIRKSEQRFIWVGMAKETAHQLGTPISSLYGWTELILNEPVSDKIAEAAADMKNDIQRLDKVANRFSQIGSRSEMTKCNVSALLSESVNYFQRRLPQLGKSVKIESSYDENLYAKVNCDLFEWAIENLIKNSLDAIENGQGTIKIDLKKQNNSGWLIIDVTDSGKGMTKQQQKNIYKPGFSTKKRGWGLGLSLTKRIIEDFHSGKLLVKESKVNEGTCMRILLKESE